MTYSAGPVDAAMDAVLTTYDQLLRLVEEGGLATVDDSRVLGFLDDVERVRNRLVFVHRQALAEAERRRLAAA